mmetsp:Transcript_14187/g.26565  ORF Transcript_14187/g.26565 Transcript_14187/m.26565 type:complete len:1074 (+) Transcript_14187:43-3264(+)
MSNNAAVKLDVTVVKSGYLVKLAMGSGRNWKKRYFILNGNTLTYYETHKNVSKPKGDLLLTSEAVVENSSVPGKDYCLMITTPFHTLVLAAKDDAERVSWGMAIEKAIEVTRKSCRGYVTKKGGIMDGGKSRKFFIMHEAAITWHKDHEHTSAIQGMLKLSADTSMDINDEQKKINLYDAISKSSLGLRFEDHEKDFGMWKRAISKVLEKFTAAEEEAHRRIEHAYENATKRGKLRLRPAKGGDIWDEFYFVLTMNELLVMEKNDEGQMEVIDVHDIHPSCSVFETNLGLYAFELVTSKRVLHVMSESREGTAAWIHAIRTSIANSQPENNDPLLQAAMIKLEEDVFYDVSFVEDKPLGVVLERSGEWAVVKLSNSRDTGVTIGSALTTINGESCVLKTYSQTIDLLKNWKPPLTLGFRRPPSKSGYMVKLSRQRRGNNQRNWQKRHFCLSEGRLVYKEHENSPVIKGDVPLMGSAVSLVSSTETGKFFCFRLVSGVTSLVMQGETLDEMMEWASSLYHAIAIANGGSHILGVERQRIGKELEKERARQEIIEQRRLAEEQKAREEAEAAAKAKAREEARIQAEKDRAQMEEQERKRLEAADKKQRDIEDATDLLTAAMSKMDLSSLEQAVEFVETMPVASEVALLSESKAKAKEMRDKEEADQRAKAEATAKLNTVTASATIDSINELSDALGAAEEVHADQESIDTARTKLITLRKERVANDEVSELLKNALAARNQDSIVEALMAAAIIDYSSPDVSEAQSLLATLQAEEKRRLEEDEARLVAEELALEISLAKENEAASQKTMEQIDEDEFKIYEALEKTQPKLATVPLGEDSDDELLDEVDSEAEDEDLDSDEEEELMQKMPPPPPAAHASGVKSTPTTDTSGAIYDRNALKKTGAEMYNPSNDQQGYNAPRVSRAKPTATGSAKVEHFHSRQSSRQRAATMRSQGRKIASRRSRLENERKQANMASEPITVSDNEMISIYKSYCRRNAIGAEGVNALQFSVVWRLVSGEKGNLFREMQIFHRFDVQNDGFLSEEDWIQGWRDLGKQPGMAKIVNQMKNLSGENTLLM